jgi:hypothetical protein
MAAQFLRNPIPHPPRRDEEKVKKFSLDEQIERARHAAARMDAGYYFNDNELEDEGSARAPYRPRDANDNEWL